MQKLLLLFLLLISVKAFSDNSLIDFINKTKYDQIYCGKNISNKEKKYIKNTATYAVDYCMTDNSLNTQYKTDFEQLLHKAQSQPEKYGFYIATAYMSGLGVERNTKLAGDWMQKSAKAGNTQATYAYYIFELEGGSETCNQQASTCIHTIYKELKKLNTAKAYEILSSYNPDPKTQCKYNKKAVELGSIDAYPAYVACYIESKNQPMTDAMHDKLTQIFSGPSTSLYTKAAAADLLGKKKEAELLYSVVQ